MSEETKSPLAIGARNLEEMITYCREAITLCPPGHPDRSSSLSSLAIAVLTRYEQSGRMEDLEEAITYHRETLTLRPTGHPDRPMCLNNLASAVLTRYKQLGSMVDLEEVIMYNREALTLCPVGHPDRSSSLDGLAIAVRTRSDQLGSMEDLEEAITYQREALTLCPTGHPSRSSSLNNLAGAVHTRYNQLGSMEDLDEAITYNHEALSLRPIGHPSRFKSLNNLAVAVFTRYNRLGSMKDLEEAITYFREVLTFHPPGHPDYPMCLNNLASAVLTRYKQLGSMKDLELEEVITYLREALSRHPPGHPHRSKPLNNLASAVLSRYERLGSIEDLEEVIMYHREALTLCPPGHPNRSTSLHNLADSILDLYKQLGRMKDLEIAHITRSDKLGSMDLEEAIAYHREAVTLCPPGHPDRSSSLSGLAVAVFTRYEQSGRMGDLEEVITYHREALTLCPPGHPKRSFSLNQLAVAVCTRSDKLGSMENFEEVITYLREALTLHPPGHPRHSMCLNNLAIAILIRAKQSGSMEDLEVVITYQRKVLTLCPSGHPRRSMSLSNLASAIRSRYNQLRSMEDLEEVIMYNREALTLYPTGHPSCSMSLNNLASAVYARYVKSCMMEDFEESLLLREQAVNDLAASSMYRFTAALHWARLAQIHNHDSVIRAYSMTLHLLDHCLTFFPDIGSQQKFLAATRIPKSLASDAASAAINAGDLEKAVELLEQGRAILWSKMKGYRYSLDPLRQVNRQLVDALEKISVQLERLAFSSDSGQMVYDRSNLEVQMQRNHILLSVGIVEWEKIIEQIREIDGFRNFLQAVPFLTLRTAAAEGPVILINISRYRSDAIIIHIDKPPTLVALPNVQPDHLTDLGWQLELALKPDTPQAKRSTLISPILCDLWNDIVFPVCKTLHQLGVPQQSRIWWCPTSELCALPLHAAGLYDPKKRMYDLPNIFTSSYTPTISALISARSNTGTVIDQSIVPKLLVIGPDKSLTKVQDEINEIQQLGDFVDVMIGADASHEAVLHGLQQHSWAHFACHGHLNNSQPFHASFKLYDDHLTLRDLIQARLPNSEFAFLASCHSAAGDPNTPDETIHLAAALQFCGFRSVVGTLWELADKAAPIVSKAFYNYMFRNPGNKADIRDSAKALSVAIGELRKQGAPLDCWIVLVHIGI